MAGVGVGDQALEGVAGPSLTPRRSSKCLTFLLSFVGVEPTSVLGILSFQERNPDFPWNLGERSAKKEGLSDVPVLKYRALILGKVQPWIQVYGLFQLQSLYDCTL